MIAPWRGKLTAVIASTDFQPPPNVVIVNAPHVIRDVEDHRRKLYRLSLLHGRGAVEHGCHAAALSRVI